MENKDGTITLKNDKVIISDPEGLGRYPRITPGKKVRVIIDGEEIEQETVVYSKNKIEIEKDEKSCQKDISIRYENNHLKVFIKIEIKPGATVKIKEINSVNLAVIEGEIVEYHYPEITQKEIEDFLSQNNVIYGIKDEAINDLVNCKETKEVLIAEGDPYVPGEDGKVVPVKKDQRMLADNFNCIESFSLGEIVAQKISSKPGESGKNVHGKEITPPQINEVELIAGDGIKLTDDKLKAIAIKNGMPKIKNRENNRIVSIIPQYVIDGNIDKTTGNIKYEGDLIVRGGIFDYFDVNVGHNLKVHESIAGSKVKANGDVLVRKNIFSSSIQAGLFLEKDVYNKILKLHKYITKLLHAISEIMGEAHKRKKISKQKMQTGRILRLLLNKKKFKDIIPLIKTVNKDIKGKGYNSKIDSILSELVEKITGYKKILQIQDTYLLEECQIELGNIIESQNNLKETHVYADYIQNSTVVASGNVVIMNKGCYNSTINVGQDIIVFGQNGFIKGGYYAADGYIYAKEVGSGLSLTEFSIGEGLYVQSLRGNIKIKSVHDSMMIDDTYDSVNVIVDQNGKIKHKSSPPHIKSIKKLTRYEQIPLVTEKTS